MALPRRLVNESMDAARERLAAAGTNQVVLHTLAAAASCIEANDPDIVHIRTVLLQCVRAPDADTFSRGIPSNTYLKDRKFRCKKLLHHSMAWFHALSHENMLQSNQAEGWWAAVEARINNTKPAEDFNEQRGVRSCAIHPVDCIANLSNWIQDWTLPLGPLVVALSYFAARKCVGSGTRDRPPPVPLRSVVHVLSTILKLPVSAKQRPTMAEWQDALVCAIMLERASCIFLPASPLDDLAALLRKHISQLHLHIAATDSKFEMAWELAKARFQHAHPVLIPQKQQAFMDKWNHKRVADGFRVSHAALTVQAEVQSCIASAQQRAQDAPPLEPETNALDIHIRQNFYAVDFQRKSAVDGSESDDEREPQADADAYDSETSDSESVSQASNQDAGEETYYTDDSDGPVHPIPKRNAFKVSAKRTRDAMAERASTKALPKQLPKVLPKRSRMQ